MREYYWGHDRQLVEGIHILLPPPFAAPPPHSDFPPVEYEIVNFRIAHISTVEIDKSVSAKDILSDKREKKKKKNELQLLLHAHWVKGII